MQHPDTKGCIVRIETMADRKLTTIVKLVTSKLAEENIPYCLIGALALGRYGLPRFTADIDLLIEGRVRDRLSSLMEYLGYACYQKTPSFARFDSEIAVLGSVDFLFVETEDGLTILKRSIAIEDPLLGRQAILQPTDFIVLKMMAIANNPNRLPQDEADIMAVLRLSRKGLIPEEFQDIDMEALRRFADRFGKAELLDGCIEKVGRPKPKTLGTFTL